MLVRIALLAFQYVVIGLLYGLHVSPVEAEVVVLLVCLQLQLDVLHQRSQAVAKALDANLIVNILQYVAYAVLLILPLG